MNSEFAQAVVRLAEAAHAVNCRFPETGISEGYPENLPSFDEAAAAIVCWAEKLTGKPLMPEPDVYRCSKCHSTNVEQAMLVNPNNEQVGEVYGEWNEASSCSDCSATNCIEDVPGSDGPLESPEYVAPEPATVRLSTEVGQVNYDAAKAQVEADRSSKVPDAPEEPFCQDCSDLLVGERLAGASCPECEKALQAAPETPETVTVELTREQAGFLSSRLHEAASHADGEVRTLTLCRDILTSLGSEDSRYLASVCDEWIEDSTATPSTGLPGFSTTEPMATDLAKNHPLFAAAVDGICVENPDRWTICVGEDGRLNANPDEGEAGDRMVWLEDCEPGWALYWQAAHKILRGF